MDRPFVFSIENADVFLFLMMNTAGVFSLKKKKGRWTVEKHVHRIHVAVAGL
jgi:hypothetical protein